MLHEKRDKQLPARKLLVSNILPIFPGEWWWEWRSRAQCGHLLWPWKGQAPPYRAWVSQVTRQLYFLYWKETRFILFIYFFWQNLLYQTTFFEARNILTFLFAFFDERTKLKALHFSIFFAAWAFQKWEIRSNICSLQRDLALLILHVTNRRDRCSLASSESLSLGYSWVIWGWSWLEEVGDEGWANAELPVFESAHVPLYPVVFGAISPSLKLLFSH